MLRNSMLRDPGILRNLQYFEATARHSSVRAAAKEMGVSPSAISHQLRALTETLGETLFEKQGRGVALTEAGATLYRRLGPTLAEIDSIIRDLRDKGEQTLRIGVCSAFGTAWLAPRLAAFQKANPDLSLELRLSGQESDQIHAAADAIIGTQSVMPGYESVALFDEYLVAVRGARACAGSDGEPHVLITTELEPGVPGADWIAFESETGRDLTTYSAGTWLRCTHYLLAKELARANVGLALIPDFQARDALEDGSLVRFDPGTYASGRAYQISFKTARAADPNIRTLVDWITSQV